jgi:hypothetical protein
VCVCVCVKRVNGGVFIENIHDREAVGKSKTIPQAPHARICGRSVGATTRCSGKRPHVLAVPGLAVTVWPRCDHAEPVRKARMAAGAVHQPHGNGEGVRPAPSALRGGYQCRKHMAERHHRFVPDSHRQLLGRGINTAPEHDAIVKN